MATVGVKCLILFWLSQSRVFAVIRWWNQGC